MIYESFESPESPNQEPSSNYSVNTFPKVFSKIALTKNKRKDMRYTELTEYDESLKNLKGYDLLIAQLTLEQIKSLDLSEVHPQISFKLIEKYNDIFSKDEE